MNLQERKLFYWIDTWSLWTNMKNWSRRFSIKTSFSESSVTSVNKSRLWKRIKPYIWGEIPVERMCGKKIRWPLAFAVEYSDILGREFAQTGCASSLVTTLTKCGTNYKIIISKKSYFSSDFNGNPNFGVLFLAHFNKNRKPKVCQKTRPSKCKANSVTLHQIVTISNSH